MKELVPRFAIAFVARRVYGENYVSLPMRHSLETSADRTTVEYQVEHPRWRVWRAEAAALACDVSTLYGPEFAEALSGSPSTAFVAEGSAVVVRQGRSLAAQTSSSSPSPETSS